MCCCAQLHVRLTVHFFSFKLRSVGVSGRRVDVHLKDETRFLALIQRWVPCVHAGSGPSGHKEMG